jgi:hypothetical protein
MRGVNFGQFTRPATPTEIVRPRRTAATCERLEPTVGEENDSRFGGNHWCRSFVDGGADPGAVNSAQVSGGDRQVGVSSRLWMMSSEMPSVTSRPRVHA